MSALRNTAVFALVALSLISCRYWFEPMPKKVVFLGDSLTGWYDWTRRFPDHSVMNLGIAGEPLEGLLARRAVIREQLRSPDYIFLMTGINDITFGRNEIRAPFQEIVRNLCTWYRGCTIVVQSLLPVDIPEVDNRVIEETNRQLRQIAYEQHAEYLDIYSRFVDKNGKVLEGLLNDDGVHLTSKGYEVWSSEVERFLKGRK